jgi:hypothetical protein
LSEIISIYIYIYIYIDGELPVVEVVENHQKDRGTQIGLEAAAS